MALIKCRICLRYPMPKPSGEMFSILQGGAATGQGNWVLLSRIWSKKENPVYLFLFLSFMLLFIFNSVTLQNDSASAGDSGTEKPSSPLRRVSLALRVRFLSEEYGARKERAHGWTLSFNRRQPCEGLPRSRLAGDGATRDDGHATWAPVRIGALPHGRPVHPSFDHFPLPSARRWNLLPPQRD